jgi:hypothetical protein
MEKITCKKLKFFLLLKIISLRHLHIDQHKADTPMRIKTLDCLSTPFNQFPNIFVILVGGGRLLVKLTVRHISLAKGHDKNKCSTVSCSPQKTHLVHPFHCLFATLSFVNSTLLLRNHIKILFLGGFSSSKDISASTLYDHS